MSLSLLFRIAPVRRAWFRALAVGRGRGEEKGRPGLFARCRRTSRYGTSRESRLPWQLGRVYLSHEAVKAPQAHVGRHTEAFLDMQYARKLRRMAGKPVYTPPQKTVLAWHELPCFQPDPRWAQEVHHEKWQTDGIPADVRDVPLHVQWAMQDRGELPPPGHPAYTADIPGRDAGATGGDHPAGEPHHRDWTPRPLSPARDGLARWVEAALANATTDDTVIDADHGTFTRWLENVVGGDPWDGLGSQDAYLERVCPPVRAIAVRQA